MTDLEIVLRCSEAMDYQVDGVALHGSGAAVWIKGMSYFIYCPLHDENQAMDLLVRMQLGFTPVVTSQGKGWAVVHQESNNIEWNKDKSRAICTLVAKMQKVKK
jgi:hypothetical protein